MNIFRRLLCALHLCETFHTQSDSVGIWAQCDLCGKCAAYVSRAELRRLDARHHPKDMPRTHAEVEKLKQYAIRPMDQPEPGDDGYEPGNG